MKRVLGSVLVAGVLLLGACSSDSSDSTEDSETTTTTAVDVIPDSEVTTDSEPVDEAAEEPVDEAAEEPDAGGSGLKGAYAAMVDAGIACDGEVEAADASDETVEPAPVEMFECTNDDGSVTMGLGWDSEDDANQAVTQLGELYCTDSIELTLVGESGWIITMMEITPENEATADDLFLDIAEAVDSIPDTRGCA